MRRQGQGAVPVRASGKKRLSYRQLTAMIVCSGDFQLTLFTLIGEEPGVLL